MRDLHEIVSFIQLMGSELEAKKKLGPIDQWRYSSFKELSEEMTEISKISISHMTLIRIFQVGEFRRPPQKATLDAISKYLGYTDWKDFTQANELLLQAPPQESNETPVPEEEMVQEEAAPSDQQDQAPSRKQLIPYYILSSILVGVVLLLTAWNFWGNQASAVEGEGEVYFECINPKGEFPHRLAYHYKVPGPGYHIKTVPLAFNPWNTQMPLGRNKRKKKVPVDLDPADSVLLSTGTPYPGNYLVRFMKGEETLKEFPVEISSSTWKGFISTKPKVKGGKRAKPIVVRTIQNGKLTLPDSISRRLDGLMWDHVVETNFFRSTNFDLDANKMSIEVCLKNITREDWLYCKYLRISLLTDDGFVEIPFFQSGCPQYGLVYLGDYRASFKTSDRLDAFVMDSSAWDTVRMEINDMKGRFYRKGELIDEIAYGRPLGKLTGLRFKFNGLGSLDFVRIRDEKGKILFEDDFSPIN